MNTPSSTLSARRRLRLPATRGSVVAWPALEPNGSTDSPLLPAPVSALDSRCAENRSQDGKQRLSNRLFGSEAGMATAEYAIATLAAVGLAGLLVVILRSEEVRGFLLNLIRTALSLP